MGDDLEKGSYSNVLTGEGRVGVEYGRSPRSRSRTDPQGVGQAWWLPRRDPLAVKTVVNKGTSSLREETNLLAPSEALRVTMCLYNGQQQQRKL